MKTDLTAQMIVKNEEQWVWYAIQSVLDHIDRLFIIDTGSTDNTVKIIKHISDSKIVLSQQDRVTPGQLVELRNEQLRQTTTSWFMLLDGDEVWPKATMAEFTAIIKKASPSLLGIVVPAIVPVGDLFHYQPEAAGKYKLLGRTGHMNLRGYQKTTGYGWQGIYPLEAYVDQTNQPIQTQDKKLTMLKHSYWHLTHLKRSEVDTHRKKKLEIGHRRNIKLPEVFFLTRPKIVPSPWISFSAAEKLVAQTVTPLLKIKRKI